MRTAPHSEGRLPVAWAVAGAGGLGALGWSWWEAAAGDVEPWEETVFLAINDLPDWLAIPVWPVMQFGALAAVPVTAAVSWWAWRRWRPSVGVATAGLTAWLLAKVVKETVDRGRPAEFIEDVAFRGEVPSGLGFVSGHVAVATAMATVLHPYLSRRWRWAVWGAVAVTAFGRMYVGAHLPLDIVGGAGLGLAIGVAWRLGAGVDRHT